MANAASPIISNEEWRAVVGYESWYEISNLGRIRRVKAVAGTRPGRVLSPHNNGKGYLRVYLSRSNVRTQAYIHRLVAAAFIGTLSNKLDINHLNGVKDDNRVENLEIVTRSQNQIHSYRVLGRRNADQRGEANHVAKLTNADVLAIRERRANGERGIDLAREFGVSRTQIWFIVTRRHWKHLP